MASDQLNKIVHCQDYTQKYRLFDSSVIKLIKQRIAEQTPFWPCGLFRSGKSGLEKQNYEELSIIRCNIL